MPVHPVNSPKRKCRVLPQIFQQEIRQDVRDLRKYCRGVVWLSKGSPVFGHVHIHHGSACSLLVQILKPRISSNKLEGSIADWAVAVFLNQDLCNAFLVRVSVVDFLAVDEHDDVRVLFD